MSRLPGRPPFGSKATPEQNESPLLGSDEEGISSENVTPQFASESSKPAPAAPVLGRVSKAPAAPQRLPEPPKAAPTMDAASTTGHTPLAPPTLHTSTAPSIETLTFGAKQATAEELEQQHQREIAINNLPNHLKNSIFKFFELVQDETSTEITLSGPKNVGFKRQGQRFIDNEIDFGDVETYHAIINSFLLPLTNTYDRIGETEYLIEGQLVIPDSADPSRPPLVARVHILAPPTATAAVITIAKKSRTQLTIDAMVGSGSMTEDMGRFLKEIARGRATVVFSGVSGAGKTTLLEAMSREFDVSDRVILIEDVEELTLPVSDVTPLRAHQPRPGDDPRKAVSLEWLVRQAQRMRPDRIVVGEVRGAEMAEFLTAANSGADGSMTTVHASSPHEAIQKMVSLSQKNINGKSEQSILRDIASTVQVIVQMNLVDGRHVISQIEEVSRTVNVNNMGIQTLPLYRFDRNTGRFNFENRPSDEFSSFLKQRGVTITVPTANTFMSRF